MYIFELKGYDLISREFEGIVFSFLRDKDCVLEMKYLKYEKMI